MKRLFVYDLDGTLVDTLKDITQAANHMLQTLKKPLVAPVEIRHLVGRGMHQLIQGCLQTEESAQVDHAMAIYRAYYAQHLLDHSQLYPGVREFLECFRDRLQAVISNKPNPYSRDLLMGLGIGRWFVEIIGGDTPYPRKPDPSALCALMKAHQVECADTVFIGDSGVDVETGRRAGVATAVVTHGFADPEELRVAQPDVMVENFVQLLQVAQRERW